MEVIVEMIKKSNLFFFWHIRYLICLVEEMHCVTEEGLLWDHIYSHTLERMSSVNWSFLQEMISF